MLEPGQEKVRHHSSVRGHSIFYLRFIVYEDEREVITTNVSTRGLQRQSKGKLNSDEVFEWPSLHIEHTITQIK